MRTSRRSVHTQALSHRLRDIHNLVMALAVLMVLYYVAAPLLSSFVDQRRSQEAADEKMAWIMKNTKWFDIDPHGDDNYVTYHAFNQRGDTLRCRGEAAKHNGEWFVERARVCKKIKQGFSLSSAEVAAQMKMLYVKEHFSNYQNVDPHGDEEQITFEVTYNDGWVSTCKSAAYVHKDEWIISAERLCGPWVWMSPEPPPTQTAPPAATKTA